ncbi:MAG: Uma2 family endonuclease [Xanthomonadales bacterium]|jgi:Uma2 family endonuclease|nr:Uma2 family endonuclease [Xanthomonadales bacterium]
MALPKTCTDGEFTLEHYLSWPEQERWQLLDGKAHAMAPPLIKHQRVVIELGRQLANQLLGKPCSALVAPVGVALPKPGAAQARSRSERIDTVFEPDVVVVCDPTKIGERYIRGAPDFVVEVLSPSSAAFDQIDKRRRYGQAGVRELWLIDIDAGLITVWRQNGEDFGAPEFRYAEGVIEVAALPGIALELDFLLDLRKRED